MTLSDLDLDTPIYSLPCRAWGVPCLIVLIVPPDERSLVAAFWRWRDGSLHPVTIGLA